MSKIELRRELMPPSLDSTLVRRLAQLAARLDGRNGDWQRDLGRFNRIAGTECAIEVFQGIYEAENHENWVRNLLLQQSIRACPDATREELIEVVRRAMPQNEFFEEHEAYMAIFDANVPMHRASNLIFYPPDYDSTTNTWGGGRSIGEYDPTPEQIVAWALSVSG